MTPITAPVSDMTTTAAKFLHKNTLLTWAQEHHDHNIKFLSYIQEHQQFDMETTASFYFSTRTLAVSDMTPITAPVSDMTTTAANSIFPQEH